MGDTTQRLFVMRDLTREGYYRSALGSSADVFNLSLAGIWEWKHAPVPVEPMLYFFETLCQHLKLKPGEGPVEVKPWPDVPSDECFADARTAARLLVTLAKRSEDAHLDMDHDECYRQCKALTLVLAFANSFRQEPAK